jgi:hypothetical protein
MALQFYRHTARDKRDESSHVRVVCEFARIRVCVRRTVRASLDLGVAVMYKFARV